MSKRCKKGLALVIFVTSIALIVWITLLSRIGSDVRYVYPPFWSYRAVLSGNKQVWFETLGNIILFFPLGFSFGLVFRIKKHWIIVLGLSLSFLIESNQWLLSLGSFEIDDVINNVVGLILGSTIYDLSFNTTGRTLRQILTVALFFILIITMSAINGEKWNVLSHNSGQMGETENLITLNNAPGYVGRSRFFVEIYSDGKISISGSSTIRAWKEIGNFVLPPGTYIFSGFSGTEEKTVGIELEYFAADVGKYIRLTPDIGPIDEVRFVLSESTQVRALIGVYPGGEGEFIARPAIYRED